MSTKFFFKETVWREVRVKLSEEQEKEVASLVEDGTIQNVDDLYEYLDDNDIYPHENDFNVDTAEPMSKEENDGQPTIEVYLTGSEEILPDITN